MYKKYSRDLALGTLANVAAALLILAGAWLLATPGAFTIVLIAGIVAAVAALTHLSLTRPRSVSGRVAFMSANLSALQRENARHRPGRNSRMITTRFSNWDTVELSEERARLRVQNDTAAATGVRLSRMHNVRTEEDRQKLEYELRRYAGQSNVSVRALYCVDPRLIPELIITVGYAAIGPSGEDGKMAFGFIYRDKVSIEAVNEYFLSLWSAAEPLLEAGRLDEAAHQRLGEWSPDLLDG